MATDVKVPVIKPARPFVSARQEVIRLGQEDQLRKSIFKGLNRR